MSMSPTWTVGTVRLLDVWTSARPGCAVAQILLDAAGGRKQVRQELPTHQVGTPSAHRRGDVHSGDHPAGEVVDRGGDGAEAFLELLVDECPTLLSNQEQLGAQHGNVGDRACGQPAQLNGREVAVEPLVTLTGEQHPPHR